MWYARSFTRSAAHSLTWCRYIIFFSGVNNLFALTLMLRICASSDPFLISCDATCFVIVSVCRLQLEFLPSSKYSIRCDSVLVFFLSASFRQFVAFVASRGFFIVIFDLNVDRQHQTKHEFTFIFVQTRHFERESESQIRRALIFISFRREKWGDLCDKMWWWLYNTCTSKVSIQNSPQTRKKIFFFFPKIAPKSSCECDFECVFLANIYWQLYQW